MSITQGVLAVVIFVVGTARLTRLLLFDTYPPVAWLRVQWDKATGRSDWNTLLHCAYCAAPWITAATMALSLWLLKINVAFSEPATWFWLTAGWAAASYAAAILVAYDGDDD